MIVVLDFGSQYTQLIARRVRRGESVLRDPALPKHLWMKSRVSPTGLILSGGPSGVYAADAPASRCWDLGAGPSYSRNLLYGTMQAHD